IPTSQSIASTSNYATYAPKAPLACLPNTIAAGPRPPHLTTQEAFLMRYIQRKLMFIVSRFLMKRRWGRRLMWMWAMRAMRSRIREFVRDLAVLYPILRPAAAWI
ncbi:MAG: hypothetical protein WCB58_23130, partial [Acidobacteriaceae bacterium]